MVMRMACAAAGAALMAGLGLAAEAPESLRQGVVGYLSFDRHLSAVTPAGEDLPAEFQRHSQAFTDDLEPVFENEPRYAPGRFGQAVLVEPGYEDHDRKLNGRNFLGPEAAQLETTGEGQRPYQAVAGAELKIVKGRPGKHIGTDASVLEGERSLAVRCARTDSGAETARGVSLIPGRYTLSLFARSEAGGPAGQKLRLQLVEAGGQLIGSADVPIEPLWRRVEAAFELGKFTREPKEQTARDVRVRVLATQPGQAFRIDAVMLEMNGGYSYAGTQTASSWLEGNGYRASELLAMDALRYTLRQRTGSVAFWAQTRGRGQYRRTLFEIATGNRWQPILQLTLLQDTRLALGLRKEPPQETAAPVKIEPGAWHHYAVIWTATQATMYLDGQPLGRLDGLQIPERLPHLRLGSAGPNAAASALIDEAVFYNRPLTDAEVARLAARTESLEKELVPAVAIRPALFLETIGRTLEPQTWLAELVNRGRDDLVDATLTWRLADRLVLTRKLDRVKAGAAAPVEFRFVADLLVGAYPLEVTAEAGGPACLPAGRPAGRQVLARFQRRVEITPMPEPFENLQVAPWGWNPERALGVTFGGGDIEDAMRKGLWWAPLWHYMGYPRHVDGEDVVHGMNDVPGLANFDSPYMVRQVQREGRRLADRFAAIPAMRGFTPNSEMQWLWQHDYSPRRIAWVREKFGVDLNKWRYPPPPEKGGVDAYQTPFGRLKPSVAGLKLPPDRVLSPQAGFYAYHRWFHGPTAPTEAFLNQQLSDWIHRRRPDILTIQEPILRRPAVRAFDRMSIGQEWFYYEDPMVAVMVQEQLNAAVRGTPLRPTGMPQFLFKAGGAAPYNAIATADMWHETVWLCALQPIRMFTYWNLAVITAPDYEDHYSKCMTKAQIDQLFGSATPTREHVQQVLKDKPEVARKLMPWTPELLAAFKRFHHEEVGPLGAVIPRWRPRPRRVAILRSFASQLYSEVRWPSTTALENCAVYSGIPFDVLYDEDFEAPADPLASYQLVIVSQAVCLTRPTCDRLTAFARRGGTIVVDEGTLVKLPGARLVAGGEGLQDAFQKLKAREDELLRQFGSVSSPAYVEAMTQELQSAAASHLVIPAFREILDKAVRPEARSLTPNTWLNLLEAEGANYIGVVNNLRVRGPMYGHFGAVREKGVAQTARVEFDPALGAVVYDLLAHAPVPVKAGDKTAVMDLDLPAGGARLVMLLARPIGRLTASAAVGSATWGDQVGREVCLTAKLTDPEGQPVAGLVPCTVTIEQPDGTRSDFSRHAAFCRGGLEYRFPVPGNAPAGTWKITVFERAAGHKAEMTVAM